MVHDHELDNHIVPTMDNILHSRNPNQPYSSDENQDVIVGEDKLDLEQGYNKEIHNHRDDNNVSPIPFLQEQNGKEFSNGADFSPSTHSTFALTEHIPANYVELGNGFGLNTYRGGPPSISDSSDDDHCTHWQSPENGSPIYHEILSSNDTNSGTYNKNSENL